MASDSTTVDGSCWILAEWGIWYGALATLNAAIQKKPDDAELRAVRRALLLDESVGLPDAAACEAPVQKKPGR